MQKNQLVNFPALPDVPDHLHGRSRSVHRWSVRRSLRWANTECKEGEPHLFVIGVNSKFFNDDLTQDPAPADDGGPATHTIRVRLPGRGDRSDRDGRRSDRRGTAGPGKTLSHV